MTSQKKIEKKISKMLNALNNMRDEIDDLIIELDFIEEEFALEESEEDFIEAK